MIEKKSIIAIVPARGGSKGLSMKNIIPIQGKPLIEYTLCEAQKSKYIDKITISTDSIQIADIAANLGFPVSFMRPAELATDFASSEDVIMNAIEYHEESGDYFDILLLLQPTSPLRTVEDIDGAVNKCIELNAPACVSVCEADQSPYWMYTQENSRLRPIIDEPLVKRRQELPRVYVLNGAVYVAQSEWLRTTRNFMTADTVAHTMPPNRSQDLDSERDFKELEMYFKKMRI